MTTKQYKPDASLNLYVKDIIVLENHKPGIKSNLPFYADGFPGVVFKQSKNNAYLLPKRKRMSDFFLYGQTIHPIEIAFTGRYKMIVFQVLPFVLKTLFGVNPRVLNDECYNLSLVKNIDIDSILKKLHEASSTSVQISIITNFINQLITKNEKLKELQISHAIHLIFETKGKITVKALTENLYITERTIQRLFAEYVGISPKQFCKIIQFQSSFSQISTEAFSKLTDIVYENGYADQSHFIRNFKKFTGKNPSLIKEDK